MQKLCRLSLNDAEHSFDTKLVYACTNVHKEGSRFKHNRAILCVEAPSFVQENNALLRE